jgi:hypothetical protein
MPLLRSSEFARIPESRVTPVGELLDTSSGNKVNLYVGKTTSALVLYDNKVPYIIPMTLNDNNNTFLYRDKVWKIVIH